MAEKIRYTVVELIMSIALIALGMAIELKGHLAKGFALMYTVVPGGMLLINILMNFIKFDNFFLFPALSMVLGIFGEVGVLAFYNVVFPDGTSFSVLLLVLILTVGLGTTFYFALRKKERTVVNWKF